MTGVSKPKKEYILSIWKSNYIHRTDRTARVQQQQLPQLHIYLWWVFKILPRDFYPLLPSATLEGFFFQALFFFLPVTVLPPHLNQIQVRTLQNINYPHTLKGGWRLAQQSHLYVHMPSPSLTLSLRAPFKHCSAASAAAVNLVVS